MSVKNKILLFKIATISIGAMGGYIYWQQWGCSNGCAITAVWWKTSLLGMAWGHLLGDVLVDRIWKKNETTT